MQSIDEIYKSYARMVYKYLYSLTRNEEIAEELTQETFYQAIKGIERFDGSCKISTWLCAIAKNQMRAYFRKHPEEENIDAVEELSEDNLETTVFSEERRVELLTKLHLCPEPYREILYLRIFGNLSFNEIGQILGKSENWARVSYYRAKEKLKKEIESDE